MAATRIFLSYHTPDHGVARRLAAALQGRDPGLEVFFAPWALRAGAFWLLELAKAITEANAFLFLLEAKSPGPRQLLEYYEAFDRKAGHRGEGIQIPTLVSPYEGGD